MTHSPEEGHRFSTFTGVFTPTFLTILGVILYVRLGWVVGNAGLGGALVILGLGLLITICTGLSLSSIATNTRIGVGGPYAIINKALGVEVGGSIGLPLFLTRPLGVAMYIFGFREGLLWVAPSLWPLGVDLGLFALLFGLAWKSAELVFKTQYLIMVIIGLSLVSIFLSPATFAPPVEIVWWGDFPGEPGGLLEGTDFWTVFAVFFPATTGILAGANMSGDLANPRRAIPVGTLAAIGLSSLVYVAVAVWCARTGTLDELSGNYNHVIDNALYPPLVLAGLLGATVSSALAGLVGGPRILMAMAQNGVVPASERLGRLRDGEPRAALAVTGVLTLACIAMRDLNIIAPLVTMFFLITYCVINLVVLLEGGLGLVSYRPTLQVPRIVPWMGLLGCLFSMFIVNPTFSLVALGLVGLTYLGVRRRDLPAQGMREDVRSGIFVAMAEWAASKVTRKDLENVRAWKPNLLVPVEDAAELDGSLGLLLDLARPEGSVRLLGLGTRQSVAELEPGLEKLGRVMEGWNLSTSWSMVGLSGYVHGAGVGMMALQGAFFRPNLLFLQLVEAGVRREEQAELIQVALEIQVGVALFARHAGGPRGQRRDIHLWVRQGRGGWDPDQAFASGNLNLNLLLGYRLWRLWKGRLTLCTIVSTAEETAEARHFLDTLCDLARFPDRVERKVFVGEVDACFRGAPVADLSIFGLQRDEPDLHWAERMTTVCRGDCLFVLDSGRESARA